MATTHRQPHPPGQLHVRRTTPGCEETPKILECRALASSRSPRGQNTNRDHLASQNARPVAPRAVRSSPMPSCSTKIPAESDTGSALVETRVLAKASGHITFSPMFSSIQRRSSRFGQRKRRRTCNKVQRYMLGHVYRAMEVNYEINSLVGLRLRCDVEGRVTLRRKRRPALAERLGD